MHTRISWLRWRGWNTSVSTPRCQTSMLLGRQLLRSSSAWEGGGKAQVREVFVRVGGVGGAHVRGACVHTCA